MVKSEQKIQSPKGSTMGSSRGIGTNNNNDKKKYKGVRMRSWGSWVSEIRAPNQKTRIWLGSYSTPEAAARAYDAALLCLKGSSANLNFPNITSSHYIPDTVMSPKSIQRVAAAAANSFVDNATSAVTTTTTPSSSSSIPSSPSDQPETYDDVSLMQSFDNYNHQPISLLDDSSWYSFDDQLIQLQSLKSLDQMFINGVSFNPMIDDFYEGDIRLWSFAE